MKTVVLICLLVSSFYSIGQATLVLTNESKSRQAVFKEKERLRVKTSQGKFTGRFEVLNDEQIVVRGDTIRIADIQKLKKQPLIMSGIVNGYLVMLGFAGVYASVAAAGITGNSVNLLGLIPSGLVMGAASLSPNPLPAYKTDVWSLAIRNN